MNRHYRIVRLHLIRPMMLTTKLTRRFKVKTKELKGKKKVFLFDFLTVNISRYATNKKSCYLNPSFLK